MAEKLALRHLLENWSKEIIENSSNPAYHRYTSFDYCYGYFYNHRKDAKWLANKQNIEKSCLHLGFYLASWGMYRGSTTLLWSSFKVYEPLIKGVIANQDRKAWEIDVDNYSKNRENLSKLHELIKGKMKQILNKWPSETLVTKIMLGIFGCTPAFDINVKSGLRKAGVGSHSSFLKNIDAVEEVYKANKAEINKESSRHKILDFAGKSTNIYYTKAKIIDMILFEYGKKSKSAGSKG